MPKCGSNCLSKYLVDVLPASEIAPGAVCHMFVSLQTDFTRQNHPHGWSSLAPLAHYWSFLLLCHVMSCLLGSDCLTKDGNVYLGEVTQLQ